MEIKLKLEKAEETLSVYEKKLTDAINEKSNLISQAVSYYLLNKFLVVKKKLTFYLVLKLLHYYILFS